MHLDRQRILSGEPSQTPVEAFFAADPSAYEQAEKVRCRAWVVGR
ncbi:hypothetical protein ACWEQG_21185 [Microbispora sp. NPDC004025]